MIICRLSSSNCHHLQLEHYNELATTSYVKSKSKIPLFGDVPVVPKAHIFLTIIWCFNQFSVNDHAFQSISLMALWIPFCLLACGKEISKKTNCFFFSSSNLNLSVVVLIKKGVVIPRNIFGLQLKFALFGSQWNKVSTIGWMHPFSRKNRS